MYTKLTTMVLITTLAAVLITSVTLAGADDASAKKKQKIKQSNKNCEDKCSNHASQIQGDNNRVSIKIRQSD